MPYKFKWLAFVVVFLWSLELMAYHKIKLEIIFLSIGYSLGVFVPSMFSWARPLRLSEGIRSRNLKSVFIILGGICGLIFVFDPLMRFFLSPQFM